MCENALGTHKLPSDRKSYYNNIRPNYNIYEIHFQFVVKKKKKKNFQGFRSVLCVCWVWHFPCCIGKEIVFWKRFVEHPECVCSHNDQSSNAIWREFPSRHITERRRPQSLICGTGIETRNSVNAKNTKIERTRKKMIYFKKKWFWFVGIFFVNLFVLDIVNENCW